MKGWWRDWGVQWGGGVFGYDENVSFATHGRASSSSGGGGSRVWQAAGPHSGSDFFQSWPKWKHLVLIRDSGCDSCSGSREDLAVGCNAGRGTRTKYTNISTVIMCQVKQAIEGSGWMCWEGSARARRASWIQGGGGGGPCGIEWDPQQDKLGHLTLIGFRIFSWQMRATALERPAQPSNIMWCCHVWFQRRKPLSVHQAEFKDSRWE